VCAKIEASWINGDHEVSLGLVNHAKQLLVGLEDPTEHSSALSGICISIAAQLTRDREFATAAQLLSGTIELGGNRTKVLRMLANCQIETKQYDGALATLMALQEAGDTGPPALFLLFRVHLAKGRVEEAAAVAAKVVRHPELTIPVGLSLCSIASENAQP
jgi:uncharacterized protein HemY